MQDLRRARHEAWLLTRKDREQENHQPGVALKHPLSGLVTCAVCGRNMVVAYRKKTKKNKKGIVVYHCPRVKSGLCENRTAVPEEWLREAILNRLIKWLFLGVEKPAATSITVEMLVSSPLFSEFRALVESELRRREADRPTILDALKAEQVSLQQEQQGILHSLTNANLDSELRRRLEEGFGQRAHRLREIETAVRNAEGVRTLADAVVQPERIAEELQRIATIVTSQNASAANLELARVLDQIRVTAAGTVHIKMCRLAFMVPAELLSPTELETDPIVVEQSSTGSRRVPSRAVPINARELLRGARDGDKSFDRTRFAGMDPTWFLTEELSIPVQETWLQVYALKVARSRLEDPCGQEKLAKRFGVSLKAIRKALQKAKESGVDATQIDGRCLRGNWAHDHATEVFRFYENNGRSLKVAADHFEKSTAWIREALKFASEGKSPGRGGEVSGDQEAPAA